MALDDAGKLQHIQASLDSYLSNTIVSAASFSLHRHGVARFVAPSNAAWVQATYDLLTMRRQHYRQVTLSATDYGTEVIGAVRCIVLQQTRSFSTRYTLASARDSVAAHFPEGGLIPIHASGDPSNPRLGAILIDSIQDIHLDTGRETGVMQHEVRVGIRYLEQYSR